MSAIWDILLIEDIVLLNISFWGYVVACVQLYDISSFPDNLTEDTKCEWD